jgi:subtilisin family serine protease
VHASRLVSALAAVALLAACADHQPTSPIDNPSFKSADAASGRYILVASGLTLPTDLAAQVASAGGQLAGSVDQIGIAYATSADPAFATNASKLRGIVGVSPDIEVQWIPRTPQVEDAGEAAETPGDAATADFETFRQVQWAPDAVHAPAAWDAGYQGAGARVAIVDGGIRSTHIDIAPNLDVAHSRSFVPGQPFNFDQAADTLGNCQYTDTFWHGTHVAGIVAAAANNVGTVGIAPQATIIGVKVLHCGSGAFSWVINGIIYAATPISEGGAGADIINMSLGAAVPRVGPLASLFVAVSRATKYAQQRGVTVVAAAGNDGVDLDHSANLFFIPAQAAGVLAVSATAPLGWALGATNFDRPASYTNFGQSAISFAAPGGDFALPGNAVCTRPRLPSGSVAAPCWVFDMVMAPCRGSGSSISSYCWAAGTSMASPAVAGVAALIVGRFGHIPPSQVQARLLQSADDLGKPGNDDFYGGGRVNAFRAVQ